MAQSIPGVTGKVGWRQSFGSPCCTGQEGSGAPQCLQHHEGEFKKVLVGFSRLEMSVGMTQLSCTSMQGSAESVLLKCIKITAEF